MTSPVPELLIISGGSEVVGLSLARAASFAAIPYAVFSLVPNSLLRKARGCTALVDLSSSLDDWMGLRDGFLQSLSGLGRASSCLAILPTEDGSLRLLNECRDDVLDWGEFPRARTLRMGGVDKAEVVEFANNKGVSQAMVPTRVLQDPDEATSAFEEFGLDAIFKPALKPLSMDLSVIGGHGAKVVTRSTAEQGPESIINALRKAWPISQRWVAQPRMRIGPSLERSVCAVRGSSVRACQVVERAKYPRIGGTAYWVTTEQRTDLVPSAAQLLEALDVVGVCELSYLPNESGEGQMIELNPRPWLQIGLVEQAGFPIVMEAVGALRGEVGETGSPRVSTKDWLQPERMLQALLSGESSLREFSHMAVLALKKSTVLGGYERSFSGLRRKRLLRSLRKLLCK